MKTKDVIVYSIIFGLFISIQITRVGINNRESEIAELRMELNDLSMEVTELGADTYTRFQNTMELGISHEARIQLCEEMHTITEKQIADKTMEVTLQVIQQSQIGE